MDKDKLVSFSSFAIGCNSLPSVTVIGGEETPLPRTQGAEEVSQSKGVVSLFSSFRRYP